MKNAEKHTKTNNHSSPNLTNESHIPFFQPKLTVGTPGDKYELEADKMADRVVEQSHEENQPFFTPAVSPPVHPVSRQAIQNSTTGDSVASQIQKQEEEEEVMQMQHEEEEEMVQAQAGEEEEIVQQKQQTEQEFFEGNNGKIVQKKPEEEDEPQMQTEDEAELQAKMEEQESLVQAKSETVLTASAGLETALNNSKGSGSPLPGEVKSQMESGFGTDFSNVRVHTGSDAVQMSNKIGAQAFTHGNDIYFNEGKFNPASQSGQHLIAHELTHTVQQGASVQPKRIQRVEDEDTLPPTAGTEEIGLVDARANTITYNSVNIPAFKGSEHRGIKYNSWNLKRSKNYNSSTRPSNQQQIWKNNINSETIVNQLRQKALEAQFQPQGEMYVFESPARPLTSGARHVARGQKNYFIGSLNDIAKASSAPAWNRRGSMTASMEVDHIVELQISGYPDNAASAAHSIDNMELLERRPNQMSGDFVKGAINGKIDLTIRNQDTKALLDQQIPGLKNERNTNKKRNFIKRNFDLIFNTYNAEGGPGVNENSYWPKEAIERGEHLDKVNAGDFSQLGEEGRIMIFPTMSGGIGKTFLWDGSDTAPNRSNKEHDWLKPFEITSKNFNTSNVEDANAPLGQLQIQIPENKRDTYKAMNDVIAINRISGANFAGRISKQSVQRSAEKLEVEKLSPVTVDYIDISPEEGIVMGGSILPTVPFISDANLQYRIAGNDLSVFKTFSSGDLNIPPPFSVSDSSLTIELSTERGFAISGQVNFGINNVGEGHIGAAASTSGGFELEGAFNFDSELFNPAEINVEYKENIWTIGGTIGIPEGKVRGVKNATITAMYSENTFTASGEAELDIPGIQRGNMEVVYGEEGFSISGDFDLKDDIPGIRGGNVSATVAKQAGEEGYSVSVSGTAQPDIPGIDSSLTVSYDNGALTIEGSAAYSRGMLAGTVNIGATNRPIGDDGQPAGDPDDTMRVYGGGSLKLTLTPWLQATAGVQFLPNGEIEVTGRIGLPSSVDVFDRKSIDRNLFTAPAVEIPIFAIPLGPRSIGLVARITGGLDFSAGFGPGQLRDLYADVTYNPDREEETTITGHGEFAIPADAGLTLRGDLGLGVSVGIASLTGGIEIAGTLGLEGEAAAEVDVNWSPQTGLALDATGRITVNPKFSFDVNAFARASLDLWVTSISETWRYNLVSFSWGPDIQFGIVFPVHYGEGEPFDMSFDDIQVIYPEIDVVDMAKGLARDVKDRIFD